MHRCRTHGYHAFDKRSEVFVVQFQRDPQSDPSAQRGAEGDESTWIAPEPGRVAVALPVSLASSVQGSSERPRSSWADPFICSSAVLDLGWAWVFGAEAKVDLNDNDLGVLRNIAAHFCERIPSAWDDGPIVPDQIRRSCAWRHTVVERGFGGSDPASDMATSVGTRHTHALSTLHGLLLQTSSFLW